MTIINATPHDINILNDNNEIVKTFEKSDMQIRVSSEEIVVDETKIDDVKIDFTKTVMGSVTGLPAKKHDTYYIVSNLVASASKRSDLLTPSKQIRNEKGHVIGCKAFNLNFN